MYNDPEYYTFFFFYNPQCPNQANLSFYYIKTPKHTGHGYVVTLEKYILTYLVGATMCLNLKFLDIMT